MSPFIEYIIKDDFLLMYLRIHEKEMHLEKGEEGLQNGVSNDNVLHTICFHRSVHRYFEPSKYQRTKSKYWKSIKLKIKLEIGNHLIL